jgi:hypothetical protein
VAHISRSDPVINSVDQPIATRSPSNSVDEPATGRLWLRVRQ